MSMKVIETNVLMILRNMPFTLGLHPEIYTP